MEDGLSEEEHAAQVTARQRQDFADQQNELMGNETGRQARFLGGANAQRTRLKKEREERAFRDALERLLQDPEYRALYEALGNRLTEAEAKADTIIAELESALRDLGMQIAEMEAHAAKGPDGQPVFMTADGQVVDAHGQALPPEIAEGIVWPPNAPSAEDYFEAKERRADGAALLDDWSTYRNGTLGGIRDRHSDRDTPMSKGDLGDAIRRIEIETPPMLNEVEADFATSVDLMPATESAPKVPILPQV